MNLILPVLLLYADAFIHELGHLLAARWAGIRVFEVSIGQGPLLFFLEGPHTGTLYTFRLLPWDGYTAMLMLPDGWRRPPEYPGCSSGHRFWHGHCNNTSRPLPPSHPYKRYRLYS